MKRFLFLLLVLLLPGLMFGASPSYQEVTNVLAVAKDRGTGTNLFFYETISFYDRDTGGPTFTDGFFFAPNSGNRTMFASGSVSNFIIRNASFLIRPVASSAFDIQQWQNSSGVSIASVRSNGVFNGDGSQLTNLTGLLAFPNAITNFDAGRNLTNLDTVAYFGGTLIGATVTSAGPATNLGRYLVMGEGANPSPSVVLSITRGIQITDLVGNPTNLEVRAFTTTARITNGSGAEVFGPSTSLSSVLSNNANGLIAANLANVPTNMTALGFIATSSSTLQNVTFGTGGTIQNGAFLANGSSALGWGSRSIMVSDVDSQILMKNNAENGFNTLWFYIGSGISNSIRGLEIVNRAHAVTNLAVAGIYVNTVSVAVGFTLTATNNTVIVTADSQTITLPTAVGIRGRSYTVKSRSAGGVTIAVTSAQTIDGTTPVALTQNQSRTYEADDTGNWIIKSGF